MHLNADFALQLAAQHQSELRQLAAERGMSRGNVRPRFLAPIRSLRHLPAT